MAPVHASRHRRGLWLLLTVLFALAGCTTQFEEDYAEAERRHAAAAAAGYEWIETGDLLERARSAADAGEMEAASQLLEKARLQAEAAVRQAEHEAGAWRDRVVK